MPMDTDEQKRRFVRNVQTMMDRKGLTVREVAKRAGVTDLKRLYRWVSNGISRAHHGHEEDLERLRTFFGLSSIGQFWREQPDQSLAERIREAGRVEREYEYAYKVLVILKGTGPQGTGQLREAIDGFYQRATLERDAKAILQPKTAEQILKHVEINFPETYRRILLWFEGDRAEALAFLAGDLEKKCHDPLDFLDLLVGYHWSRGDEPSAPDQAGDT
jgi:transcriptional regulator with XRE-family HTH domain